MKRFIAERNKIFLVSLKVNFHVLRLRTGCFYIRIIFIVCSKFVNPSCICEKYSSATTVSMALFLFFYLMNKVKIFPRCAKFHYYSTLACILHVFAFIICFNYFLETPLLLLLSNIFSLSSIYSYSFDLRGNHSEQSVNHRIRIKMIKIY